MHCLNVTSKRQIPVYILKSLANKYPCILVYTCLTIKPTQQSTRILIAFFVPGCAENDLQDSLLEYPGRCIEGSNIYWITDQTLDSCKVQCLTTPQCRSLEFFNGYVCTGASVTALQAWSSWNRYDGCSYFQRACA